MFFSLVNVIQIFWFSYSFDFHIVSVSFWFRFLTTYMAKMGHKKTKDLVLKKKNQIIFSFSCSFDFHVVSVWLSFQFWTNNLAETGHKKRLTNTVAKKGHKSIKIKISMFNSFGLIPEHCWSISQFSFGGQLSVSRSSSKRDYSEFWK